MDSMVHHCDLTYFNDSAISFFKSAVIFSLISLISPSWESLTDCISSWSFEISWINSSYRMGEILAVATHRVIARMLAILGARAAPCEFLALRASTTPSLKFLSGLRRVVNLDGVLTYLPILPQFHQPHPLKWGKRP